MGALENKSLANRFVEEVLNKGNLSVIDQYATLNFIDHRVILGLPAGREGMRAFISGLRGAFPDLHYTIDDTIAEGDKVVQRSIARGTMKGDFMGMSASGKTAIWEEIHITRFAEGRAVEHWAVVDQLGMLTQLGFAAASDRLAAGR
jgi:predicted ester cyclase